jgi:hypothetical protein
VGSKDSIRDCERSKNIASMIPSFVLDSPALGITYGGRGLSIQRIRYCSARDFLFADSNARALGGGRRQEREHNVKYGNPLNCRDIVFWHDEELWM